MMGKWKMARGLHRRKFIQIWIVFYVEIHQNNNWIIFLVFGYSNLLNVWLWPPGTLSGNAHVVVPSPGASSSIGNRS